MRKNGSSCQISRPRKLTNKKGGEQRIVLKPLCQQSSEEPLNKTFTASLRGRNYTFKIEKTKL